MRAAVCNWQCATGPAAVVLQGQQAASSHGMGAMLIMMAEDVCTYPTFPYISRTNMRCHKDGNFLTRVVEITIMAHDTARIHTEYG
jgi:hypothetical protein